MKMLSYPKENSDDIRLDNGKLNDQHRIKFKNERNFVSLKMKER